jgi:hypothetical protein
MNRMHSIKMKFRVPEGEELTEERLEALNEAGVSEDDVYSDEEGILWVICYFSSEIEEDEIEGMVEDIAERLMENIGDMEMCDFS